MRTVKKTLLVGVVAAAMFLAGCSTGGGGDSDSASVDPDAKKAAEALVADFSQVGEARKPDPVSAKPPAGKSLVVIGCPVESCTLTTDEAVKAAEALGWTAKVLVADFTPEAYLSAFDSALQLTPDYLVYIAVQPHDVIKDKLEEFKAAGIPVISNSAAPDIEVGGESPIVAAVAGGANTEQFSRLQAAVVIADAESLEHVTFMYDPASPTYVQGADVIEQDIEAAGGKLDRFEINQGDAGTTLTGQIVSYLQRNPETEYFIAPGDHLLLGLPDAIAAAGIESPTIVGLVPSEDTNGYIRDGEMLASVKWDAYGAMWDAVDIFARYGVGDEFDAQPVGDAMIVDESNVGDAPSGTFQGVPDNYLEAWLLK